MTTRPRALTLKQIREAGNRYREQRPTYEAFGVRLTDVLHELLEQDGVGLAQVECRAKKVDSFVDKLKRKRTKYSDPLKDVTDLLGVRVVTYTLTDVARVGEILRREFNVDESRSVVKPEVADPDRFGYASVHYIVSIAPPRSGLGEWTAFAGLVAEVQVRTVLQHAWSAIDHKLNYKSATEIPRDLKRRLFRMSALLEVADEQFDEVERQASAVTAGYVDRVERGRIDDLEIDASSLDVYLRASHVAERWSRIGKEVGIEVGGDDSELERDRRDLLRMLAATGVETVGEFDRLLKEAETWGKDALARMVARFVADVDAPFTSTPDDVLTLIVLIAKGAKPSIYADLLYLEPTPQVIAELVKERK